MSQNPERRFVPRATVALLLVILAVWGYSEYLGGSTNPEVLTRLGARRALWGFSEDPKHLVTSLFLHYGLWHLVSNCVSLLVFGAGVERALGSGFLLYSFFFSGVAGGLLSMVRNPQATTLGASSSLFGEVGAMLALTWLAPHVDRRNRVILSVQIGLVLLLGLRPQLLGYNIDTSAHLGGFLAGLGATLAFWMAGQGRRGWALLTVLAVALGAAVAHQCSGPQLPF